MPVSNVIVTRSGTGWTVDVTACNLLSDVNIKDFIVLHNSVVVSNTVYAKTTPTILTYTGSSLSSGTTVEIRRKTPNSIIQSVTYGQKFSSSLWNSELDRIIRWREEVDLNGAGNVVATPTPQNDPFGSVWSTDTFYPPTRKAAYDIINTLAPKDGANLTNATATTPPTSDNDTSIATTAYVQSNLANYLTTANAAITYAALSLFKPVVIATRSTNQILAPGSNTVIYNNEVVDTDNAYNSTTGIFTVPSGRGGLYLLTTNNTVLFTATSVGTAVYYGQFFLNGSTSVGQFGNLQIPGQNVNLNISGSRLLTLNQGDSVNVNINVVHTGGSPTFTLNSGDVPSLGIVRLPY